MPNQIYQVKVSLIPITIPKKENEMNNKIGGPPK
jgi:hypothetical protein